MHPSGRLLSANYGSGSVAVHLRRLGAPGERTDLVTHSEPPRTWSVGPHAPPDRPPAPTADTCSPSTWATTPSHLPPRHPGGHVAEVSDDAEAGRGPRHLTFHPRAGTPTWRTNSTTPSWSAATTRGLGLRPGAPQPTGTGSGTSYPAQLVVTGDGGYAYLANRGHNSRRGTP
ncbi:beta-propeller fold lactonase family protein [Streptomyces sp. SJL17-1]|uniref:beta-propeller fold lactonase family protein n=1 Tax=Streptomyces sp. SJL17-1 TaxID=2967223 RepID=UPI002966269C|nr:beta-propeller fold lactonase family protein [Streptomyces sp. SJL17-1]